MIHVAVVGSRDYPNLNVVREFIDRLACRPEWYGLEKGNFVVLSGGARGVDTVAIRHAEEHGLNTCILAADWETHGRAAGFLRNTELVKMADWVVAFWDGISRGTRDTLWKCAEGDVPFTVVKPDDPCPRSRL